MSAASSIEMLDHELADDELQWVRAVHQDFAAARARLPAAEFNPKETLREVLGRAEHALPTPIDLTGDGIWRGGRNRHGRLVACVFLKQVELHRHPFSRTDQFALYSVGEADAYSEDANGRPVIAPFNGGDHFHNSPDAPHAFLPKVGKPVDPDWEVAFIAITPRNLRDDTHSVTAATKAAYRQVVGTDAPAEG